MGCMSNRSCFVTTQGVHLHFWSGNEVYWKVRWEASPADGTPMRTMVVYKDWQHRAAPLVLLGRCGVERCWKADCIRLYGSTSRRSRRNHLRSIQPARFGQELFEIAINSTLRVESRKLLDGYYFYSCSVLWFFFLFVLVLWMRVSGVLFCFFRIHPRNPTWNCMLFLRFANMNPWHGLKWIYVSMPCSQKVCKHVQIQQHQHGTYLALLPLMNFNIGALTWNPSFFAQRWFSGE